MITFTKAFYDTAFGVTLQLDECKIDSTTAWDDLIEAIIMMESESIPDISGGVAQLVMILPELFNAFKECKESSSAIQDGIRNLKPFIDHSSSILLAISEAITFDPVYFTKDAYSIYTAFNIQPEDYQKGGEASGEITQMVLKFMPSSQASSTLSEPIITSL